jgi:hypothetical protein
MAMQLVKVIEAHHWDAYHYIRQFVLYELRGRDGYVYRLEIIGARAAFYEVVVWHLPEPKRDEGEFIARKFDAAGLPCTVVELVGASKDGVRTEPPRHNAAAQRNLRRSSLEQPSPIEDHQGDVSFGRH